MSPAPTRDDGGVDTAKLVDACEARLAGISSLTTSSLALNLLDTQAWSHVRWSILLLVLKAVLGVLSPLSIYWLLLWYEQPDASIKWGLICAAINAVAQFGHQLCHKLFATWSSRAGLRCQVTASCLLYRRLLGLNVAAASQWKSGELTVLISSDVENVTGLIAGVCSLVLQPFEIVASIALQWLIVESAVVGGLFFAAVSFVISHFGGQAMERYNAKRSAYSDQRLKLLSEVLYGLKVIKANGWMHRFLEKVSAVASTESRAALYKKRIFGQVLVFTNEMVDIMALSVILLSILALGNVPTASRLFSLWIFMAHLHSKIFAFPETLRKVTSARSSLKRIADFLEQTRESQQRTSEQETASNGEADSSAAVSAADACFSYDYGRLQGEQLQVCDAPILKNVNLQFEAGALYGIVGKVGSGKTSLLLGLMGELSSSGRIKGVKGSAKLAYVPQDPILFNDTVQNNVCFGLAFDQERYRAACSACMLDRDIQLFPKGDETVLGSRGINISGGQQSRICLARAVYADADVYFLDDPLAKLDVRVAGEVFEAAILTLLKQKTRLLVSNSTHIVARCDAVIQLSEGTAALPEATNAAELEMASPCSADEEGGGSPTSVATALPGTEDEEATDALLALLPEMEQSRFRKSAIGFGLHHLVATVNTKWRFAVYYLLVLGETLVIETGVAVLAMWTADPDEENYSSGFYSGVYASMVALEIMLAQVRLQCLAYFAQGAWHRLHQGVLVSVLNASFSWLQTVPVGHLLQVFSGTLGKIEDCSFHTFELFGFSFTIVIVMMVIFAYGYPIFLVVVLICLLMLAVIIRRMMSKMSDAQALEGSLKRSCLQHYTESLTGLPLIRAFRGATGLFVDKFEHMTVKRAALQQSCLDDDETGLLQLSLAGAFVYVALVFGVVIWRESSGASAGFVGFLLVNGSFFNICLTTASTQALALWGLGRDRELVERLTHTAPQESSARGAALEKSWPSKGDIVIENLEVRYRPELPPAIKELSLTVRGGEHMGIIGRTGSGKSSLLLAITRLVEPASGRITIDGVDILSIGLQDLRPHLGVLSQDPLFFSGTLRDNLDPFNEHADTVLWESLDSVGLGSFFKSSSGLEAPVTELGGNLSTGQRQLLCLARAALRDPKVLLVDEATAALDVAADKRVQTVLDERFSAQGATVLQVAHRLWSIARCHRIAVFDEGRLAELGSPAELLSVDFQGEGRFRAMVDALGKDEAAAFSQALTTQEVLAI
eukprot:TRINITY_DN491_c0_g2_i1.p1 TRINITY_DN491_c0_g2~~TRINITY_DN491_c0_g2_i1.p1  ORF type:complete len:1241 (-),score=223.56 TRINITY_DN491_c0_g2_i1:227-3949(-)